MGAETRFVPRLAQTLKVSDRGKVYRNSPFAATVLNAKHPQFRGAYLKLLKSQWADWSHLTPTVRSGHLLDHDVPDSVGSRRHFPRAIHYRSLDVSARVAAQIDLPQAKTFFPLDFIEEANRDSTM